MPIEICTISGFSKTEGNSVAVKIDNEVVILDMGLSMSDYIRFTEDLEDITPKTYSSLLKAGAVPNYKFIEDWRKNVIAIVPNHGHLDHIGAVPFASPLFPNAPIITTPLAAEVLKRTLYDEEMEIPNEIIAQPMNSIFSLSKTITAEFISIIHSIPQTAIVVLHTPYGKVVYANDFKMDKHTILDEKSNFSRLKELGKENDIVIIIINCLYAHEAKKADSEVVAQQMLDELLPNVNKSHKAVIITTFSSHIARLTHILNLGKKINRKVILLGRSLEKYVQSAQQLDLLDKEIRVIRFRRHLEKIFRKIQQEGKEKYLIVCTGHQGEPRSIISRLARQELPLKLEKDDCVIFSSNVIPVEINIENRKRLETILEKAKVKIFCDIHVSGHGALEDEKELLQILNPKHIIPIQ